MDMSLSIDLAGINREIADISGEESGADEPCDRSVWTCSGHSDLKTSAPVREPSPPQTASASMPSLIRLYAALRRPSGVRNACERAVPMRVPPYSRMSHQDTILSNALCELDEGG